MTRILILATLLVTTPLAAQDPTSWKAGVATTIVTPDTPMWMAGYASRNKPSEGKVHDLYAKALALESNDGQRLVIVTLDLISVPRPIRDTLEKVVKRTIRTACCRVADQLFAYSLRSGNPHNALVAGRVAAGKTQVCGSLRRVVADETGEPRR